MDFYRINEEYNCFCQRYEKEKRGVIHIEKIIKGYYKVDLKIIKGI